MKLARDGRLGFGPPPGPATFIRPVWDRLVVLERDNDGNPTRWLEEIDGCGAVEFTGLIRQAWLDEIRVTQAGIVEAYAPPLHASESNP